MIFWGLIYSLGANARVVNSRKLLFGILTVLSLGISNPAAAEELTMICRNKDDVNIYKYSNPLLGRKQVLERIDGKWIPWGSTYAEPHEPKKLSIYDRGAVLTYVVKHTAKGANKPIGLELGDPFLVKFRWTLDFQFLTHKQTATFTKPDGRAIIHGQKGYDPDVPDTLSGKCEKDD